MIFIFSLSHLMFQKRYKYTSSCSYVSLLLTTMQFSFYSTLTNVYYCQNSMGPFFHQEKKNTFLFKKIPISKNVELYRVLIKKQPI